MAPTDARLAGANFVYLKYCTSDAWVGSAPAALPNFPMLGRVYVAAVFTELAAAHGMGAAAGTKVLFTGCSAGARGALFNTAFVAGLLPTLMPAANLATFAALYDSAWWMDLAPLSPSAVPFRKQVQDVYALVGADAPGYLNPACRCALRAARRAPARQARPLTPFFPSLPPPPPAPSIPRPLRGAAPPFPAPTGGSA